MRQRLAQEAARLMAEEGVRDFYSAKRKAAERLGASNTHNMPRNQEIEAALQDHQRLFQGDAQQQNLRELRTAAVQAMQFFADFEPRLTGSVLSGTAGEHSDINLHLFAEVSEDVHLFLMEAGVPFEAGHRRIRIGRDQSEDIPSLRFIAGDAHIEALIFPTKGLRQAPPSPLDGRPMARAGLNQVMELLEENS